ncbi:MAG TPA: BPSS1780 family membrane protein [Burkholderiales bacterium]|nr:BPSS1780 family membrane protein [Burkholderiales bacterium]
MRIVSARSGWSWLVRGFALFRKSPPMWLFLALMYFVAQILFAQFRYLGPAVFMVLLPGFVMSFMFVCAVIEHGGMPRPSLLVSGFRSGLSTLMLLGVLQLLAIAAVLGLASLADAGALAGSLLYGQEPPEDAINDGSASRALVIMALAGTPILMAFWFAPLLAAWSRMGAVQAVFYSFFAVWRNWRAFLVYGGAIFLAGVLFLLATTVVTMLAQRKMEAVQMLTLAFTLLTFPTLVASLYASYRDIFPENAVPAEPPPPSDAGSP